tara:strand:- start:90 stop:479 length:390 start_codon:yes stop_codon:yes gene_type:complete
MDLGALCVFLIARGFYKDWTLERVERQFVPPMSHGQALLFQKDEKLVAAVTWAFVSDKVLMELMQGNRAVRPDEWRCGENVFFADFLVADGHTREVMQRIRAKFKEHLGPGVRGHWYRRAKERPGYVTT